ncbi:MAG: hypothetical protein KDK33_20320, partial [Leptospiraceae bacterium]|nr:hypothetical protein [Leptospiraceae bacterium]
SSPTISRGKTTLNATVMITVVYDELAKSNIAHPNISLPGALFLCDIGTQNADGILAAANLFCFGLFIFPELLHGVGFIYILPHHPH